MRINQPIDKRFLLLLTGVVLFGLVMLLSAAGPLGVQKFDDSWYFFKHQLVNGIVPGLFVFFIMAKLDYRKLRPLALPAVILSIILLILVYVPGVGMRFGGAGRWIDLGIAFQPSEFVKVGFLIYVAAWLASKHESKAKTLEEGLLPFLTVLGLVVALLIFQPNTGSMAVISGMALLMYFVAGAPVIWFVVLGFSFLSLVALLIKLTPYRAARFMTFLHPELDPQGIGYHINQAFLAIGSGGLFGLGYGHSRQKYQYLPEVAGDSIFAVMAEELGFFLCAAFIVALAFLIHRCFVIAAGAKDEFGRFLATGVGAWFAIQAILNISSMIGLMPMTGVTLPFVSYGSSAFVALAMGAGIVASVSKQSSV
ncbi:MAG: putative peptidoglycan glycosyltransferase FtsW [Patescibacteria group bacterium]|nr:putative peptidoglycan glycosyltransferase FtsW [Patescibacteria group bacterium]